MLSWVYSCSEYVCVCIYIDISDLLFVCTCLSYRGSSAPRSVQTVSDVIGEEEVVRRSESRQSDPSGRREGKPHRAL